MKILVCGSRDFLDYDFLATWLDGFAEKNEITQVIHGAYRGVDSLADKWAKDKGLDVRPFPADWKKHGKLAGPIRNQQMLDEGKPDLVIAFPGGTGTANMIIKATKAGVQIIHVPLTS